MLAVRTQTPIVPVVICNRTKIFRMTHVVIGEPFELSEYYGKKPSPKDYAVMDEEIKQRMYALRAQFREEQAAKKAKKTREKRAQEQGMKVIVARNCGFCSGVKKAVDTALRVPADNTYILGELIHNEDVNDRIRARGIRVVDDLAAVPDGARLLIRSHGVPKAVYAECERRNIRVIDCTCSFVANSQRIVERESRAGKVIAITGTPRASRGGRSHRLVRRGRYTSFPRRTKIFPALREKMSFYCRRPPFRRKDFRKLQKILQKCVQKQLLFLRQFAILLYAGKKKPRAWRRLRMQSS